MSPQSNTSADCDDKQVKMRARMSMGVPGCVCVCVCVCEILCVWERDREANPAHDTFFPFFLLFVAYLNLRSGWVVSNFHLLGADILVSWRTCGKKGEKKTGRLHLSHYFIHISLNFPFDGYSEGVCVCVREKEPECVHFLCNLVESSQTPLI